MRLSHANIDWCLTRKQHAGHAIREPNAASDNIAFARSSADVHRQEPSILKSPIESAMRADQGIDPDVEEA